jgi:hypothetical protein
MSPKTILIHSSSLCFNILGYVEIYIYVIPSKCLKNLVISNIRLEIEMCYQHFKSKKKYSYELKLVEDEAKLVVIRSNYFKRFN